MKCLNILKEDSNNYYIKAKTGPSKLTKIPKKISPTLGCFIGLIIGDGHLHKVKKRIVIEISDKELIESIKKIVIKLFGITPPIYFRKDKRPNRKQRYILQIDNSAIYTLLNKTYEIPSGNKSTLVKIPKLIKNSSLKNKKSFLIGYLAADGGKRRKEMGSTTASKILQKDLSNLLNELKIPHSTEKWLYEKYKKEYFGIYFKKKQFLQSMWECRSGQTGWILFSLQKKVRGYA